MQDGEWTMEENRQRKLSSDKHALTILVIDDEKVARLALTRMLMKSGYTNVKSVGSGREALDYIRSQPHPHLILCDVKMPEINGIEFLTLLYAEPEYTNIPVIMISATDELQLVYQCLKIGAADFLVKPVRVKQVEKLWQVIWRKKRDEKDKVKAQENNVKIQQAMESKITEAVSTSITAIVNYVSQLLSTCDTETKDALCNILQTLHRSNFYKSAIESYLSSNAIDNETKRWFSNELQLNAERSQNVQAVAPVSVIDSGITHKLRSNNFDVWRIGEDKVFFNMITGIFNDFMLLSTFKISTGDFLAFLQTIRSNYFDSNPYHNFRHAFDVLQSLYLMLTNCKASDYLTSIEIFTVMLAGLLHDVGHNGTSNKFHIETYSDIAIKYNDHSVLENYHCALGWKLLRKCKILDNIPPEDIRQIRNLYIQCVLSTDLARHIIVTRLLMKLADLSNPTKPFPVARYWALMIQEEFFQQGDKEKRLGLAYSPFAERGNTSLAQMQLNFANFVVIPFYMEAKSVLPLLEEEIIPQLLENRTKWASMK